MSFTRPLSRAGKHSTVFRYPSPDVSYFSVFSAVPAGLIYHIPLLTKLALLLWRSDQAGDASAGRAQPC